MPAEIDTMAYAGDIPWHRQGTRLENPATAEEAMKAASLGWEVQKQPIFTGVDRNVRVKDRFVMCRTDRLDQEDGGQLGIVGSDYEPLQNRDAFTFMDPVVGVGAAIYHTAGSLRGGKQVWLLAALPGEIRVVGDDIVGKFLLLSNSHDGSSAVRVLFTPVRVVCQNTLSLALRDASGLWIGHYSDVLERVRQAHRLMGIVNTAYDRTASVMQSMARVPLIMGRPRDYFAQIMPLPHVEELREKVRLRHNRLNELFHTGDGNDMPGVRGTLWAAYNAVTQWVDRESYTRRNREPLRSIWFGYGAQVKERAFAVAEEMARAAAN